MDSVSGNRIQSVGAGLEAFVKDSFASTFNCSKVEERIRIHEKEFSYGGGTNNPPDIILKNGEAIEVKKIGGFGRVPLNSSFPKDMLYKKDPLITKECRNADSGNWEKKPIFYYIGTIPKGKNELSCLFIVEGTCYCASYDTYINIKDQIRLGVSNLGDFDFGETGELGRINRLDPLGITNLRIRGMWDIQHPIRVFNQDIDDLIVQPDNNKLIYAIIRKESYLNASKEDREELESLKNAEIYDKKVKDPNNTAKLLDAKLIKVCL
jgi:hypothetical protein